MQAFWQRSGTLWLALTALILHHTPGLDDWFSLKTETFSWSNGWQVFTCHLSHWNGQHFWWDWLVFIVLGWLCERESPRAFWLALGSASVSIVAVFLIFETQFSSYRGLSGWDSALFLLWLVLVMKPSSWRGMAFKFGLGLGFMGKVGLEWFYQTTLFVDSSSAAFQPVPSAHMVGGLCGLLVGLVFLRKPRDIKSNRVESLKKKSPKENLKLINQASLKAKERACCSR